VTGLVNVLREDIAKHWNEDEIKSALNLAPELDGRNIKVKRVLE
jgi:Asp-tRNA(Asn)/Glu-tRNA(Gln) amidotransferase C subunit